MFRASFATPRRFHSETELQQAFGSDQVHLADGGSVIMCGAIALGRGATIGGHCEMADGTIVDTGSILTDVVLGTGNRVRPYSVISDLRAGNENLFGPFCFVRDGCVVADRCILGSHVEAARSRFDSGVKVSHRAFIGDARVGGDTVIGCGVVFCNWDGEARQQSKVGANVTLGSGSLLVAPAAIADRAVVGAGSVVTRAVGPGERMIQKRT